MRTLLSTTGRSTPQRTAETVGAVEYAQHDDAAARVQRKTGPSSARCPGPPDAEPDTERQAALNRMRLAHASRPSPPLVVPVLR
jgi:hypothetical protein